MSRNVRNSIAGLISSARSKHRCGQPTVARATSEEGRVCSLQQASRETEALPGFEVVETPRVWTVAVQKEGFFLFFLFFGVEMKQPTSSVLFQHWSHSERRVERCGCGMNSSKKRDSFRIYGLASMFGRPVED